MMVLFLVCLMMACSFSLGVCRLRFPVMRFLFRLRRSSWVGRGWISFPLWFPVNWVNCLCLVLVRVDLCIWFFVLFRACLRIMFFSILCVFFVFVCFLNITVRHVKGCLCYWVGVARPYYNLCINLVTLFTVTLYFWHIDWTFMTFVNPLLRKCVML